MTKIISGLTAFAALAALAGAANAQDMHVRYGDLDLSRPADAQTFQARTQKAAVDICRALSENVGLQHSRCVTVARDLAIEELPTAARKAYLQALNSHAQPNATQLAQASTAR